MWQRFIHTIKSESLLKLSTTVPEATIGCHTMTHPKVKSKWKSGVFAAAPDLVSKAGVLRGTQIKVYLKTKIVCHSRLSCARHHHTYNIEITFLPFCKDAEIPHDVGWLRFRGTESHRWPRCHPASSSFSSFSFQMKVFFLQRAFVILAEDVEERRSLTIIWPLVLDLKICLPVWQWFTLTSWQNLIYHNQRRRSISHQH